MKKTLLPFIAFTSLSLASFTSNSQTWYWTKQADSSTTQTASQVAVDRNNNPVYTGYCSGTRMAFGNIGINVTGSQSDFLVKYSSAGTPLWARSALALDPSTYIYGNSVAIDRNNDVLEAGYFSDSIAFGTYHLSSNSGNANMYLAKYDGNGTLLWATCPTFSSPLSNEYNQAFCVAADKKNNIYVTGYFQDTIIFGRDTLSTLGTADMFLTKYSPSGGVIWAKELTNNGGGSISYGLSVAVDDSGNAYIGGNFGDTVYFGTIKLWTLSPGAEEIYLAKFDSSGNIKWAQSTKATPGQLLPTPVEVDKSNNVYLGAQFTNLSLTFGAYTVTNGSTDGASNAMLVKYTPNGNVIWATCADYISQAEVNTIIESSVAIDRCNNVYWSGLCSDSFGVGNVKVTEQGGWSHPSRDFAYVIKLDSNANPVAGATMANQNANSFSNYLAVDSLSKALFASELVAPATLVIGSDTVNRYGSSTCFLSKFEVIPAVLLGTNGSDTICSGDSAVLSITTTTNTTFIWSTGATTSSITVKPTATTTYSVSINNGCQIDTSYIKVTVISVKPIVTGNDTICSGNSTTLTASGGTTYLWNPGSLSGSSVTVSPTVNTIYTLAATTAGCTKDTTYSVIVVNALTTSINAIPDTICAGDSALLIGGGGGKYTWSNGKTTDSIWYKIDTTTKVTLHINTNGCIDSTSKTITVKPKGNTTLTLTKDSICPYDTTTLIASGGSAYKWSNGSTNSSISVVPGSTKTYTLISTVQCAIDTILKTVNVIPLPVFSVTGNLQPCVGKSDTIGISGGSYTYSWSNGTTSSSYILKNVYADSTISVQVNNGKCYVDDTLKVSVKFPPTVTVPPGSICAGQCDTLTATASGTGNTYSWSNGGTSSTDIVCPDSNATYTLTVSNGCTNTIKSKVSVYDAALFACCPKTIQPGGADTIIADSMQYYTWVPATGLNCDTCRTVIATPTVTTTYTVIGRDGSGCETERYVRVDVEILCYNFTIPNVFTPNGDGRNDDFLVTTKNLDSYAITIYDRWGKEIYTSTDPTASWDGNTKGGEKASDGVYYYIISATCNGTSGNNNYKKDGFVQLIR